MGGAEMKSKSTDELLAKVPLFEGLSAKELGEISNLTTRMTLRAGRHLTEQGALGQEFLIVHEGTVDVLIDGVVVASPAAGQCYGEIALLEARPRTATVVAKTDVTVDIIGRREFADMLELQPRLAERLARAIASYPADDQTDDPRP